MLNKLCEENKCTGCMACVNICPFGAITYKNNSLGNIVPFIDEEKCRNCGLCTKVCPQLSPAQFNAPKKVFAAFTNDILDRETCSSGGIATVFAKKYIENGGFAAGAVMAQEYNPVMCVVDNLAGVEKLKGSKYVQCNMLDTYKKIEERLKNNQKGVFIGTPCQVAGLKKYLKKPYDNLLTVDLICHGVPSAEYLKEHLNKYSGIDGKLTFRGKYDFCLHLEDVNGKVVFNRWKDTDTYFYSFLQGLTYRESCYSCQYAQEKRVSDITLGDFWGVDRERIGGYKGRASLVIASTQKGIYEFLSCGDSITMYESNMEDAKRENLQLREPSKKHKDRAIFCSEYSKTSSFEKAIKKTTVHQSIKDIELENKNKKLKRGFNKLFRIIGIKK